MEKKKTIETIKQQQQQHYQQQQTNNNKNTQLTYLHTKDLVFQLSHLF